MKNMQLDFPKNYVVFDFETNGLDPYTNKVIEIGAKKVSESEVLESKSWLIRIPERIPVNITSITGIDDEMLDRYGVSEPEAWMQFLDFIKGSILVGHNIAHFDLLFLKASAERIYLAMNDHISIIENYSFVDTAAFVKARKLGYAHFDGESHEDFANRILSTKAYGITYKLTEAYQAVGGSMENIVAHRAAGDVEMTDFLYRNIAGFDTNHSIL